MGLKNEKVHFNVGCILFLDANKAYLFDNSVLGIVFFLKNLQALKTWNQPWYVLSQLLQKVYITFVKPMQQLYVEEAYGFYIKDHAVILVYVNNMYVNICVNCL